MKPDTKPLRFSIELRATERLKDGPFIAGGPGKVGFVDDIPRAREALAAKAGRYPDFGCPLVLAMLPASMSFDDRTALDVLYGSEAVQFSVDDPTFANPTPARLDATGSGWSVAIPTPAIGKHTIYAESIQGFDTSAPASRTFTVTK